LVPVFLVPVCAAAAVFGAVLAVFVAGFVLASALEARAVVFVDAAVAFVAVALASLFAVAAALVRDAMHASRWESVGRYPGGT